jgi:hypothetical protein
MIPVVRRRLAYLAVWTAFALLRLLPSSDRDKDVEILALRHQIGVLQQQLARQRPRFQPADRALLAGPAARPGCCASCGCSGSRTRSCAGTATCSHGNTLPGPGPSD